MLSVAVLGSAGLRRGTAGAGAWARRFLAFRLAILLTTQETLDG